MRKDRRKDRRRDFSGRRAEDKGTLNVKNALLAGLIIVAIGLIAFFVTIKIYNNNLDKMYSDLGERESASVKAYDKLEEASSQIGKGPNELQKENINATPNNNENTGVISEDKKEETEVKTPEPTKKPTPTPTPVPDPVFALPVEGTLAKEYANDKLVYSETLKEWVVHTGIDIKADKTTVVKASEKGKVTAIKNDPRYGITVIIEHTNGFETRYANLLTAEFVNVGDSVEKGETIGTVGNTGAFEVLDDPHLHFEILRNGEYQDPSIYVEI